MFIRVDTIDGTGGFLFPQGSPETAMNISDFGSGQTSDVNKEFQGLSIMLVRFSE